MAIRGTQFKPTVVTTFGSVVNKAAHMIIHKHNSINDLSVFLDNSAICLNPSPKTYVSVIIRENDPRELELVNKK